LKTADPRATLQDLMTARNPVYAQADLVVDSDNGSIEQTVNRVHDTIKNYFEQQSE
jgi:shikimate kinase